MEKIFSSAGDYEKYGEMLKKRLEENDYSPQIYLAYCKFLRKTGKKDEAVIKLKEFLARFPEQPQAMMLLGDIFLEEEHIDEAVEFYRKLSRRGVNTKKPFVCTNCGYRVDEMVWRCPKCGKWDSVKYMPEIE